MSRMSNLHGDLSAGIQSLEAGQASHNETLGLASHKMDDLLHLMAEMAGAESRIEKMEKNILDVLCRLETSQVDSGKLVDRLIEMTMVTRDQPKDAAIHRAQSRLESNFSDPQSWTEDETPEDVWPPPGSDAMDVRG